MEKHRILLVEDDRFKRDRIEACLQNIGVPIDLVRVESVQSAVRVVLEGVFDVVLLDMALPSHDLRVGAGQSASLLSGGLEVIMELGYLRREDKVVVITQYPEVELEGRLVPIKAVKKVLKETFQANIVEVILYEHESDAWVPLLMKSVECT